ncbi:MAG: MFS transporter [Acetobacteraceae bacterium]|nr:MFS transporter [Acetobacteraceae bacterium]
MDRGPAEGSAPAAGAAGARAAGEPRLWSQYLHLGKYIYWLVLASVLISVGGQLEAALFPVYFQELGGSPRALGWYMSLTHLLIGGFMILGGWAADRYDRRWLFVLASGLALGRYVMLAASPNWIWLYPALLLLVGASVLSNPLFFSLTADLSPPGRRGAAFAFANGALSLVGALTPLAGGIVYQFKGFRLLLWACAGLAAVAAYLRSLLIEPRKLQAGAVPASGGAASAAVPKGAGAPMGAAPEGPGGAPARSPAGPSRPGLKDPFREVGLAIWQAVHTPELVLALVALGVLSFVITLAQVYYPLYALNELRLPVGWVGGLYSWQCVAGTLAGMAVGGLLVRRLHLCVAGSAAAAALAALGLGLGRSLPWAFVAFGLAGVCSGVAMPASMVWISANSPPGKMNTVYAAFRCVLIFANMPAPACGGLLWSRFGPQAMLHAQFWPAAVFFVGFAAFLGLKRGLTPSRARTGAA